MTKESRNITNRITRVKDKVNIWCVYLAGNLTPFSAVAHLSGGFMIQQLLWHQKCCMVYGYAKIHSLQRNILSKNFTSQNILTCQENEANFKM